MNDKKLIERLIEAGYPKEEMYHHCSDLYVFVTPTTTEVIKKWCEDNEFRFDHFVSTFKDQVTGRKMYDVAFRYYPYWEEKK